MRRIALLFISLSLLFSSDQRIAALGGNSGFWHDDDSNWMTFPAMINQLDMVQVSGLGDNTVPGSATLVWGDDVTFAFKYNQSIVDHEDALRDWINIGWGNGQLGAYLNIGSKSYDSGEPNSTPSSTSYYGVGLGRMTSFGELGTSFNMLAIDDGNVNTEDKGSMMFSANIRRDQNIWLFNRMLIGFDWNTITGNDSDVDTKDSENWIDFDIDFYTHLNPTKSVDILFALGFSYWSHTGTGIDGVSGNDDDVSQSIMTLPQTTIAVEASLKDWAICRFGVNHAFMMGTNGDESWSGSYNYLNNSTSTFNWNFGLGLDFSSFSVDMLIKDSFFTDPIPYLTGFNNADLAEGSVTLTYKF